MSAGPEGAPPRSCTRVPVSQKLAFHSGINTESLAHFRASYSFEEEKKS